VRTEEDLRNALLSLERHAPVVTAARIRAVRRRRTRIRACCAGAAAGVAVTAAVVTAVAVLPAQPARPGKNATAQPQNSAVHTVLTAREVLLTAAASAAAAPDSGTYWQVETVNGTLRATGPDAHPYAVMEKWTPAQSWDARSSSGRSWFLPATGYTSAPASAGAQAAWQADGSPAGPAQTGQQQAWWQTGGAVGYFGDQSLTFAQFQALPSAPDALATAMRAEISGEHIPARAGITVDQRMSDICVQLLELDPIGSAQRSAVFQILAGLSDVRSVGEVTDPLGRTGYGIELSGKPSEIIVVAPQTGALLAKEYLAGSLPPGVTSPSPSGAAPGADASCPARAPAEEGTAGQLNPGACGPVLAVAPGTVIGYEAVLSEGWTDAAPSLPPPADQFSVATQGKG
jgi:hypothetical protein